MKYGLSLTVLLVATLSISGHNAAIADDSTKSNKALRIVTKLADAMGGVDKVLAVKNQQIVAEVSTFLPEQTQRPGTAPLLVAKLTRSLTKDFTTPRSFSSWQVKVDYPMVVDFDFEERINGSQGAIIGVDGFFGQPPQATMKSNRLGARAKTYLMGSPLSLVRWALERTGELRYVGKRKYNDQKYHLVIMPGLGQPITLFINARTKLLSKAVTMEDAVIYGDAIFATTFTQWSEADELMLPTVVHYSLAGRKIGYEVRSEINIDISVNDDLFTIPALLQTPMNSDLYSWGLRSSQWFTRYLTIGIPFDTDQRGTDAVNLVDVSPGIYLITGSIHNSMVVEMSDFLVVMDPVIHSDRSQTILNILKDKWPDKPVKYVVASHFHADHIGGVRGYAAVGANIVVGEGTGSHFADILQASHTVHPDAYSIGPKNVDIVEVSKDEPYVITDGDRVIKTYNTKNRHAIGMLVPYVEDAKVIFTSDAYSPGAFPIPLPSQFVFWAFDLFDALEELNLSIETIVGAHGGSVSYAQFVSDVENSR